MYFWPLNLSIIFLDYVTFLYISVILKLYIFIYLLYCIFFQIHHIHPYLSIYGILSTWLLISFLVHFHIQKHVRSLLENLLPSPPTGDAITGVTLPWGLSDLPGDNNFRVYSIELRVSLFFHHFCHYFFHFYIGGNSHSISSLPYNGIFQCPRFGWPLSYINYIYTRV